MSRQKSKRSGTPFAKRSLGQNFLVDKNVIQKIVESLGPIDNDLVVEIGPGRGALTDLLVSAAGHYVAIELDRVFAAALKARYEDNKNIRIFEKDVLETDFSEIVSGIEGFEKIKIVANLPYNISTAILEKLANAPIDFSFAVLMFQKEVVSRITAAPGKKDRGYLTLITESSFETEFLFDVHPKAFKPVPRVRSAVVKVRPKKAKGIDDEKAFRAVLSAGFGQKRKTLANNLKNMVEIKDIKQFLESVGIKPERRPGTLELEEWIRITRKLAESAG